MRRGNSEENGPTEVGRRLRVGSRPGRGARRLGLRHYLIMLRARRASAPQAAPGTLSGAAHFADRAFPQALASRHPFRSAVAPSSPNTNGCEQPLARHPWRRGRNRGRQPLAGLGTVFVAIARLAVRAVARLRSVVSFVEHLHARLVARGEHQCPRLRLPAIFKVAGAATSEPDRLGICEPGR